MGVIVDVGMPVSISTLSVVGEADTAVTCSDGSGVQEPRIITSKKKAAIFRMGCSRSSYD